MKRSDINHAIEKAKLVMQQHSFCLPPFAYYHLTDWQNNVTNSHEIQQAHLGWDITDFNLGDFANVGLSLFTLRNQSPNNDKPYAEKIMVVHTGQVTPMHYHWKKMEDIINRGGGNLIVQLYHRNEDTDLLDYEKPVQISIDGEQRTIKAGEKICLSPGQSICLYPLLYHSFWAENDAVLAGEVSMANDDLTDNRFLEPLGRFSHIEEDVQPIHLLCSDYKEFLCR
ncbi:D-lyxose/D-mannose family sugar isomerase [Conservatibacter flavescens]|uniref:D-lyxose ketol-isomerase n=1 Tax=Conservatibacter flavescens TaxID=28161 RepID=A0A2M8S136_9PAST|nr:D-lyxose/D-mannose family sugar isomerase [Conservatibacter flavescens]PJG84845.1 D-lyxose/D-mannose family sugar isomerase [Conservatibacter flavescens]